MPDLFELLREYKEISLKIIKDLEINNSEELEKDLGRKDEIQSNIDSLNPPTKNFRDAAIGLEIEKVENQLESILLRKRSEAKAELTKISQIRKLRNNYNNTISQINFFNKKI